MGTVDNPGEQQLNSPDNRDWGIFSAFRYADFRVLWASTMTNQIGQGMQQVLLGFLVFEMTDSGGMVGVAFAARSAPHLLVGFVAGSVTDRLDRRTLMRAAVGGMVVVSLTLALISFSGGLRVWHLITLAFCFGGCQSFYITSRQVYAYDIVGSAGAVNGIAMVSLAQRIGGIIGALLGGLILSWQGPGTAFSVMAGGYTIGIVSLFGLRRLGQSAPREREPIWQNMVAYVHALRSNRAMSGLMVTTAGTEMLGFSHQVALPILADSLGVGAAGLGILTAFRFVGGALGVVALTALGRVKRRGILLLIVLALFGFGLVLLSQSPNFWVALIFVVFANSMGYSADILNQTLLQASVPNEQRGRSMGSWVVGVGTSPVGHMEIGYVAGLASARVALLTNGILLIALPLVLLLLFPRFKRL